MNSFSFCPGYHLEAVQLETETGNGRTDVSGLVVALMKTNRTGHLCIFQIHHGERYISTFLSRFLSM